MAERRAYISGVAGSIPASGIKELVFIRINRSSSVGRATHL